MTRLRTGRVMRCISSPGRGRWTRRGRMCKRLCAACNEACFDHRRGVRNRPRGRDRSRGGREPRRRTPRERERRTDVDVDHADDHLGAARVRLLERGADLPRHRTGPDRGDHLADRAGRRNHAGHLAAARRILGRISIHGDAASHRRRHRHHQCRAAQYRDATAINDRLRIARHRVRSAGPSARRQPTDSRSGSSSIGSSCNRASHVRSR